MPRTKTIAAELARLFDRSPDPIYVLDDERRIVFCNQALARWTRVQVLELIGRRVDYHSQRDPSGTPGVAAGLCPPPDAFAGWETTGHVTCMSANNRLLHREARFLPLGAGEEESNADCVGTVVFVSKVDVEATDAKSPEAEPSTDQLHLEIRRFRARQAQRYDLDLLLGHSPATRRAREQVALAAGSLTHVLVVGPGGSGRSHIAHAIHYGSDPTRQARLIPMACGLLGADALRQTMESLAGDASDGSVGTMVLNEVDALPEEVQSHLIDWLVTRTLPLRCIATTSHQLDKLVEEGEFRKDLACALSTITIELPPLSERLEDLPILAQLFVEEANREGGRQIAGVDPEALDLLASYHWPQGLDELAEVIRSAHQAAESHRIHSRDLPMRIRHLAEVSAHPRRLDETIDLDQFLGKVEIELITRAMTRAKGNKTRAAKLLGVTRPRLYRRLVQLRLVDQPDKAS